MIVVGIDTGLNGMTMNPENDLDLDDLDGE